MYKGIEKIVSIEKGRITNSIRVRRHYLQQLFWECTLRCNLNCKHCGSKCTLDNNRNEMPLQDFLPILDEVKRVVKSPILVITTGGEPLMRKDIFECGREITSRGFYWGMVTNGLLLTEECLEKLVETGLNSISVSLDGLRDVHNWMRGNVKSFDKVINAINLLTNISHNITWDVITCVNKRNIGQMEEMKQLLANLKVKNWKIFTTFPIGRAIQNDEFELNRQEFRFLMDFIVETRKEHKIKVSYGCENFLGPYEYEVRDNQYFCAAGVNVASILHDGSISGCLSIRHNYKQGNIYQDSFMDIWENRFEKYRNTKWKKTGICADCEVWRWCEGNGMHLRNDEGDLALCYYRKLYH